MNGGTQFSSHQSPITSYQSPVTSHQSPVPGSDEINLLDYWRVIKQYKKMIAGIVATASVIAMVVSLILPKTYKADALIVPVSSKGSGGGLAALASQFGGLASLAGFNVPGVADDAQKFVAILKSRTLTEHVIDKENLLPVLFEKKWDAGTQKWKTNDPNKRPTMEEAVEKMKTLISIMDDKKNKTIKISGEFKSPDVAANVVNRYLDELQIFINTNAFTTAKRNRIFIEGQLADNKRELLEAGKEINEFYRGNRVSALEAKVDVAIGTTNREPLTVNSEPEKIAAGALASLDFPSHQSSVTGNGSTVALDSFISQKAELDKKIAEASVVTDVPQQVYLSYLMLRRELLAKINALLTSQYEMAKIEESKEELSFQIIDKAVPPVLRYSPKRAQICIMSFMAALFGAVFLAFFREYLERMKAVTRDT